MPTQEDAWLNSLYANMLADRLFKGNPKDFYRMSIEASPALTDSHTEQLLQLSRGVTWDGDLISKQHRTDLVNAGLAARAKKGYNLITVKGVEYLLELDLIHP